MSHALLGSSGALAYTERYVTLSTGVTLPWVDHGTPGKVPVLFLHGFSDSWRSYQPLFPFLPPSMYSLAVSQRGHGNATRPPAAYRPIDFADDVAAFLDSQDIEAAVIVGHSMGSTVAQRFASEFPDRVLGLVMLGAIHSWQQITDVTELLEALHALEDPVDPKFVRAFQLGTITQPVPPSLVDMVVRESLKLPARVWQSVADAFIADDTAERIGNITAPTLLLWGDQDTVTNREQQDALIESIPSAHLIVYAGTGHAVHWEQTEQTATDLIEFIDTLRR